MISRTTMAGFLLMGGLAFVTGGTAWAALDKDSKEEQQAIKHTKEAIDQGKLGKADGLQKHAEMALQSAQAADKIEPEAHVTASIKHLQMAVQDAQKGNTASGTQHAEEALKSLEQEELEAK